MGNQCSFQSYQADTEVVAGTRAAHRVSTHILPKPREHTPNRMDGIDIEPSELGEAKAAFCIPE